jgi:hypothetical protein
MNEQRTIQLSEEIDQCLEKRGEDLDVSVAQQIRAAIRRYLDVQPDIWNRLLTTEREARRSPIIADELWKQLKKHGKRAGLNINESVQVAIAIYLFQEEGAVPGIKPEVLKDIATRLNLKPPAPRMDATTQASLQKLGVSLGMPQASTPGEIVPRLIAIGDEMAGGIELLKLPRTPCGPWKEALEETEPFILPKFFAELIGAHEGDLLVPTGGQSMREAGIPDDGAVVMRALDSQKPEDGAVVLACARRTDDRYFYTIKFWYHTPSGAPELRDGRLRIYNLPPDIKPEKLKPVAVLVGVIGRATLGGTVKGRQPREGREHAKKTSGEKWEFPESE